MVTEYRRPVPEPDEDTTDFWDGCKRNELILKHCEDCGYYIHPPKQRCPKCLSTNVDNTQVSGRATVYSYTIVHTETAPGFTPPYNVALVALEEQEDIRLMTNIVDCTQDQLKIGLPVEVLFQDATEDVSIPLFRPRI